MTKVYTALCFWAFGYLCICWWNEGQRRIYCQGTNCLLVVLCGRILILSNLQNAIISRKVTSYKSDYSWLCSDSKDGYKDYHAITTITKWGEIFLESRTVITKTPLVRECKMLIVFWESVVTKIHLSSGQNMHSSF